MEIIFWILGSALSVVVGLVLIINLCFFYKRRSLNKRIRDIMNIICNYHGSATKATLKAKGVSSKLSVLSRDTMNFIRLYWWVEHLLIPYYFAKVREDFLFLLLKEIVKAREKVDKAYDPSFNRTKNPTP